MSKFENFTKKSERGQLKFLPSFFQKACGVKRQSLLWVFKGKALDISLLLKNILCILTIV